MAARPAKIPGTPPAAPSPSGAAREERVDWSRVAALVQASRALDDIEETRLLPERKVLYQFSARGHELAQILLGLQLTDPHDGIGVYYRSRPLMLTLGVGLEDAAAGPLPRSRGLTGRGRHRAVVFTPPRPPRPAC